MDTSKKYILMCEKAEEIQKGWKPQAFDCFVPKNRETWQSHPYDMEGESGYLVVGCPGLKQNDFFSVATYDAEWEKEDSIYLPRQDQLQEMVVKESDILPWTLQSRFNKWTHIVYEHESPLTSMEQLWLAFVMKEKYKKTWNGKEWVK